MLGTAYKMKIYTKANTAIENHFCMLLLRVWGKKWMTNYFLTFILSFGIFWGFSCVIQLLTWTSIPGAGSAIGYGYLACLYIKRSWISAISVVSEAVLVLPGVFITLSSKNVSTSCPVSPSLNPLQDSEWRTSQTKFFSNIAQLSTKLFSEINQDL